MYTAAQYRTAAVEFGNRAIVALNESERAEYKTLESSFKTLADNADWLTANDSKVVHSSGEPQNLPERQQSLSHDPQCFLRSLGAATMLRWDALPEDLQQEIFERARTMSAALSPALSEKTSQFLYSRGDEASRESDGQPLAFDVAAKHSADQVIVEMRDGQALDKATKADRRDQLTELPE